MYVTHLQCQVHTNGNKIKQELLTQIMPILQIQVKDGGISSKTLNSSKVLNIYSLGAYSKISLFYNYDTFTIPIQSRSSYADLISFEYCPFLNNIKQLFSKSCTLSLNSNFLF